MNCRLLVVAAIGAAATISGTSVAKVTPPAHRAVGMGVPDAKLPVPPGAPPAMARFDRHHHHFDDGFGGVGYAYGYNLGNSYDDADWASNSGNSWWHDRPDRAYPRWVQEQRRTGTCDPDRMWWSGSGWHC